ncbi:MAG TPA: hypothetical protein VI387_01495, partial [Candidatus Brocadiales bacterium]|nr:hypothetical protein [Candidatus Brocadiales bacterium]
ELGIYAGRRTGFTGVWVDGEKIGSIGVRIVMGYTMHGFSLNVNNDLSPFNMIIPCNIQDVKMTSVCETKGLRLKAEGVAWTNSFVRAGFLTCKEVADIIVKHFANVFDAEIHKWNEDLPGLEQNYLPEMATKQ